MTDQDSLRFPVGRFKAPAASTAETRSAQIETLRRLPERLRAAVSGLSEAQIDTPYREGGWTVRQVVHHIADSHANSYIRFKLALTEDWPTVKPYDEAAWARLTDYTTPIDGPLVFIDALHSRWVGLLSALTDVEFARGYNHPESGRQTLEFALGVYEWHSRHHVAHITALRQRMGW
jgi:hypothetical protein